MWEWRRFCSRGCATSSQLAALSSQEKHRTSIGWGFLRAASCELRATLHLPMNVDRKAWRALFAAQLGWMLDAMDFLLFTFALVSIKKELG